MVEIKNTMDGQMETEWIQLKNELSNSKTMLKKSSRRKQSDKSFLLTYSWFTINFRCTAKWVIYIYIYLFRFFLLHGITRECYIYQISISIYLSIYIYIYPYIYLSFQVLSITGYYKIVNIVPSVILGPCCSLFYIQSCIHVNWDSQGIWW